MLKTLDLHCKANEDANMITEQRFNVIPIIAVVVIEQDGDNDDVIGIPMPFGSLSLESLCASGPNSTTSASSSKDLKIARGELQDLAHCVHKLAEVWVVRGDINERNTLKRPHEATAAKAYQGQSHNNIAPGTLTIKS